MQDTIAAQKILTVFARYGFKKTSMEDIAQAADLSRQSIYNRFGSKEAVFDWTVETITTELFRQVTKVLTSKTETPLETLLQAYNIWTGNHVSIWMGTGHGAEIIDLAMASANRSASYQGDGFAILISEFILKSGLEKDRSPAENKAFVLNLASKGLLLIAKSSEEYAKGMQRVIFATLG
ncbi:MAG: TetR/AcrR family transcriptional regulator [Rhodobacteraceae bacterium]|nr:TetR/AcrR family transcriptional regulator [Paracoccaceae bacterium]